MKTLGLKKLETPDTQLPKYFELGKTCENKALSKIQIKRLYYKWLDKSTDGRTFDEVFADKMLEHKNFWGEVKAAKMKHFVRRKIGHFECFNDYEVNKVYAIFRSCEHNTLTISKPITSTKADMAWVETKIVDYCRERSCSVDDSGFIYTECDI